MPKSGLNALFLNVFCCPTWSGTLAFLAGTRGTLCPTFGVQNGVLPVLPKSGTVAKRAAFYRLANAKNGADAVSS